MLNNDCLVMLKMFVGHFVNLCLPLDKLMSNVVVVVVFVVYFSFSSKTSFSSSPLSSSFLYTSLDLMSVERRSVKRCREWLLPWENNNSRVSTEASVSINSNCIISAVLFSCFLSENCHRPMNDLLFVVSLQSKCCYSFQKSIGDTTLPSLQFSTLSVFPLPLLHKLLWISCF